MIAAKLRTPEQTDWWVRLVMAAFALALALARDLAEDLRHPWEKPPAPDRPLTPAESAAGSGTSNAYWAPLDRPGDLGGYLAWLPTIRLADPCVMWNDSSYSFGGIPPQYEWSLSLLYHATQSMVAMVTSVTPSQSLW